jgi:hypothetical protein
MMRAGDYDRDPESGLFLPRREMRASPQWMAGPAFFGGGAVSPYARWNPADKGSACTLSNGNLTFDATAVNGAVRSTIGKSSGKWYWEVTSNGTLLPMVGIGLSTTPLTNFVGTSSDGWSFYGFGLKKINNGVQTAYGSAWVSTDVIGVKLDVGGGTLEFLKNNVSMGVAFTGLGAGTYYAMGSGYTGPSTSNCTANFGASAFAYTPPAGYSAGLF